MYKSSSPNNWGLVRQVIKRVAKDFGTTGFAQALLSVAELRAATLVSPIQTGESSHISPALVLLGLTLENVRR